MPKTNHKRSFKDLRDYSIRGMLLRNHALGAMGNDFTNGKHGAARNRKGFKKFRNSRRRFHQKDDLYHELKIVLQ